MKVWMYLRLVIGLLFRKRLHFILLTAIHRFKVDFSVFCSICLKSGNMKPLVAKWPCCFKDIYIYIYIYIYIQVLIDLYPPSREEFNKNESGSHSEYSLIECTHVLSHMMPDKWMQHWCRPLQTSLFFSVNAQLGLLMCIPLGQRKTFLKCYTPFHLICISAICSCMWDDMQIYSIPISITDLCI